MQDVDLEQIVQIQKQFIIFVGNEICTIAEAEQRGLVAVQVDPDTGDVAYTEIVAPKRDSEYRALFEATH